MLKIFIWPEWNHLSQSTTKPTKWPVHPAKTHIWVFAGRTCHFVGFVMLWLIYQYYRNNPKFSDRQVWANSVDLDQTVRQEQSDQGLHCLPFHLHIWVHYSVESNRVQILGWLQQIFLVSEFYTSSFAGFINSFLSWGPFIVLGRLTFSTYLIHINVLHVYFWTRRSLFYFSDTEIVSIISLMYIPSAHAQNQ